MSNPTTDYITDNLEMSVENYVAAMTNAMDRRLGVSDVMELLEYQDTEELVSFINKWR